MIVILAHGWCARDISKIFPQLKIGCDAVSFGYIDLSLALYSSLESNAQFENVSTSKAKSTSKFSKIVGFPPNNIPYLGLASS